MAETEVEDILREIRERVITQQRSAPDVTTAASLAGNLAANIAANGDSRLAQAATAGTGNRETTSQSLALINSYLTTTERAWDRLPPVTSNRSGLVASVELWWKRQMKRATRWYAWEQVNFNAAVHQALRDLLPVLAAHEHELEKLRAETAASREALIEGERQQSELQGQIEELREEQRVCFKQISLETSEAATLEDRSRRKTETLLAELQRRVDEIETK